MLTPFLSRELQALKPGDTVVVHRTGTADLPMVAHVNQVNVSNVTLSGGLVACNVTGDVVAGYDKVFHMGYRPKIYRADKPLLAQIIAQRQLHQLRAIVEELGKPGFGQLDARTIERLYHTATAVASPEPIMQG